MYQNRVCWDKAVCVGTRPCVLEHAREGKETRVSIECRAGADILYPRMDL